QPEYLAGRGTPLLCYMGQLMSQQLLSRCRFGRVLPTSKYNVIPNRVCECVHRTRGFDSGSIRMNPHRAEILAHAPALGRSAHALSSRCLQDPAGNSFRLLLPSITGLIDSEPELGSWC